MAYGLIGLLKLLEQSGGEIDTRIRIQKEAYLLAIAGAKEFRQESFTYHHYGPFSRELSDTIRTAVSLVLIEEVKESFSETVARHRYRLLQSGREALKSYEAIISSSARVYEQLVPFLASQHWRTLELAATVKFLEQTERGSSRDQVIQMAITLKPETKPYRSDAVSALQSIGL